MPIESINLVIGLALRVIFQEISMFDGKNTENPMFSTADAQFKPKHWGTKVATELMGIPDDPCADGILVAKNNHKDQDFAASKYVVLKFCVLFSNFQHRPMTPMIFHLTKNELCMKHVPEMTNVLGC